MSNLSIFSGFYYIFYRFGVLEAKINGALLLSETSKNKPDESRNLPTNQTDTCGENCKNAINDIVSRSIATLSSTTKIIEKVNTVKQVGTIYIPMGTTYTTTSTDWYTIDDSEVFIDLLNDYGPGAKVSWEAQLKVAHGNGQAYARLWDDTNKISVVGSELSTVNNSDFQFVSSGSIPFWKGRNLYKLQIKSLNSFEVTVTGGKIRITY